MPSLSDSRLRASLFEALPGCKVIDDASGTKPIILSVPDIGPVRIYLWTTTQDQSSHGRPEGEHKAQIILPDTARGSIQKLDLSKMPTALLGYSPLFGVFTAWEARLHHTSAYSKNLQFREEVMEESVETGWAVGDTRITRNGPEVRVAIHPLHLIEYLKTMIEADVLKLSGDERKLFFIRRQPMPIEGVPPPEDLETAGAIEPRKHIYSKRLSRTGSFGPKVVAEYDHSCAICKIQLKTVEGAHIIPIHDKRCVDEVWNGLSLCRNHHRLYDLKIIRIDSDGKISVQAEDIAFLRSLRLLGGYESIIQPYIGRTIRLPNFYESDTKTRQKFQGALRIMSPSTSGKQITASKSE